MQRQEQGWGRQIVKWKWQECEKQCSRSINRSRGGGRS